jgi:hypothetical protein
MAELPFADFGLKWFEDIVASVTKEFVDRIEKGLTKITAEFFGTPLPQGQGIEVVFGTPAAGDEPWHSIYQAVVAGEVTVFALIILLLAVQTRHLVRIFNIGNGYDLRRTGRSAWTGAILIVGWYWLAVLVLYLIDGLTIGLLPDVTAVGDALISILPSVVTNPMLTLIMAMLGGLAMVGLVALYFIRELLLYVYLYGMPIGLAIAYANVPVLSEITQRLCRQFVPLAVLPLPAAILFQGYALLFISGPNGVTPDTPFLSYLVVVSLPILALWVTWKAFKYATPLTARVVGTGVRGVATAGAVIGAGYAAGPYAATTAARFGARAGLTQAVTQRAMGGDEQSSSSAPTTNDNTAPAVEGGVPEYRRSENDPGYY